MATNVVDQKTHAPIQGITLTPQLAADPLTSTYVGTRSEGEYFGTGAPSGFAALTGQAAGNYPTYLNWPFIRADQNGETWLMTSWLASDPATKAFLDGDAINSHWKGTQWPTYSFTNMDQGSSDYSPLANTNDVVLRTFYRPNLPNGGGIFWDLGLMGVLDLPTATRFGLAPAKLVNHAGTAVAPDEAGVMEGLKTMKVRDGTLFPDFTSNDPGAYPLVMVEYAMVTKTYGTPKKAADVKRFLEYAAGDGQSHLPAGLFPLTDALRQQTLDVAKSISYAKPGTPPPSSGPTTSTSMPTTTTTSAATVAGSGDTSGSGNPDVSSGTYTAAGAGGDFGSSGSTPDAGVPGVGGGGTHNGGRKPATKPAGGDASTPDRSKQPIVHLADAGAHLALPVMMLLALLAAIVSLGMKNSKHLARTRAVLDWVPKRFRRRRGARPSPQPTGA